MSFALAMAVVLSGCPPAFSRPLQPSTQGELKVEPTPAADFINAFRRGDEVAAERQASPLYREEWARRKISITERQAWLPAAYRAGQSGTEWMNVSYMGG